MQKYIEKNEYPNENIEIIICLTSFNIEQNEYLDILSYLCMVNKYIYGYTKDNTTTRRKPHELGG